MGAASRLPPLPQTPSTPPVNTLHIKRYGSKTCCSRRTILMLLSNDGVRMMHFYLWSERPLANLRNREIQNPRKKRGLSATYSTTSRRGEMYITTKREDEEEEVSSY